MTDNTKIIWIIVLIIAGVYLMNNKILFQGAITGSETMRRIVPSNVLPNSTFNIYYTAENYNDKWGATITDSVSGGCVILDSNNNSVKELILSVNYNVSYSVIAPASGSCIFSGDYKFGSRDILQFAQSTVTVRNSTTQCTVHSDCNDDLTITDDFCISNVCYHSPAVVGGNNINDSNQSGNDDNNDDTQSSNLGIFVIGGIILIGAVIVFKRFR